MASAPVWATMVVGARTKYALGRDWVSLGQLGTWSGQTGSPGRAYALQAAISLGLIALGMREADGFSAMVEFTAPMFWSFLMLVGLALMWLRRTDSAAISDAPTDDKRSIKELAHSGHEGKWR